MPEIPALAGSDPRVGEHRRRYRCPACGHLVASAGPVYGMLQASGRSGSFVYLRRHKAAGQSRASRHRRASSTSSGWGPDVDEGFPVVCAHVQAAGSAVAVALLECDALAPAVGSDAGGDLAAIRRILLDAARLLDRAERLSHPIEPGGTR
jgi:hypothetical protein